MSTPRVSTSVSRRELLKGAAGGAAAALLAVGAPRASAQDSQPAAKLKGRIKQGACGGVFGRLSLEERCQTCVKLGIKGMDFIGAGDWPTLKKHGLVCTLVGSHGIGSGFNRKENHPACVAAVKKAIEAAAEAGWPNVICFSGNRHKGADDKEGVSDEEGAKNCAEGLKQVAGLAEEKKVTLCMELLNSKRNHKDYQCDRTAWGVDVCKKVGSPRMKLLYDIYHMQVQEGDVIATIRESIDYIGHFHTAGVPGRNEIDESQELYYPAIMKAIADLTAAGKYDGYVAHEYGPKRNALESLAKAVAICDV
jgi:hydroxypyruvate isomerase